MTTTRNREIDRMALAHACIVVLLHPLLSRGETGEKDDDGGEGGEGASRARGANRKRKKRKTQAAGL